MRFIYNRILPHRISRSCQARSKATDSRSVPAGVRRFESGLRHHYYNTFRLTAMAEPQKIAIASLVIFILGAVFLSLTFLVPGLSTSGEFSITIVAGLILMVLAGFLFLLQATPISVNYVQNPSSFNIRGPYFGKEIQYSDIAAVEYREFLPGMPLIALKSFEGILGGQFRSSELGMCHAIGFNRGEGTKFILMEMSDGKIVAFNLESEEGTESVYSTIMSKALVRKAGPIKKNTRRD